MSFVQVAGKKGGMLFHRITGYLIGKCPKEILRQTRNI